MRAPVTPSEVVLRGCVLKSCAYVIAVVVFTGSQSKLMMNRSPTPSKVGRREERKYRRIRAPLHTDPM